MKKRLLVTGADGFTGRHFSRSAEADGYEVFPLLCNLVDAEAVAKEVSAIGPSHVCHLAAVSAVTHADEAAFYQVNLFGTLNLIKALQQLPVAPQKILLASSANVYGNIKASASISECLCPKPVNHYAMSKLAMEHMALTYINQLPIVITRPFNYTGVGHDNRFVVPKIVEHFAKGATKIELGNLDVEREYNDVRMVNDAYLKLLSMGKSGEIYNVCSGRTFSLRVVVSMLENIVGRPMALTVNPAFVRPNEVYRLAGDGTKLEEAVGSLTQVPLEETLGWMLSEMKA